ncbi:MAG: helix-turn-helix domain-containing protein [Tannerellaceae bacterium]|jgi:transcriptional regulator with XRE-family HTH domain|nr:helix-turn-helix domain-containing protein [Tannerellaceae bacterium]
MSKYFDFKEFRDAYGISSQAQIAEILGCTQSFISRIERGRESMPPEMFERLCNLYGSEEQLKVYLKDKAKKPKLNNLSNVNGDNIQGGSVSISQAETARFFDLLQEKDEQINRLIDLLFDKIHDK